MHRSFENRLGDSLSGTPQNTNGRVPADRVDLDSAAEVIPRSLESEAEVLRTPICLDCLDEIESELRMLPQFKLMVSRHATLIRWASLALVLVAVLLFLRALPPERLLSFVRDWIGGLGMWGPVALGLIYVAAALLLAPGWILTVAAGALYGLLVGTIVVSLASTTAVALAFLIARYLARDRVRRQIEKSPKLAAVDQAIGEQGWKIVALLRLSPAVPFNLQNYLYGVTAVRFWPCVLVSWATMLPGTFLYVYFGSLGRTAVQGQTSAAEWVLRGIGLIAIVAVTVYITRLARRAIREKTQIEDSESRAPERARHGPGANGRPVRWPWGSLAAAALAFVSLGLAGWALANQDLIRGYVERLAGLPPAVESTEKYSERPDGPTFDHSAFDELLRKHVDSAGWVDYRGFQKDADRLDRYLEQLADAPFEKLGRNEKLALLINAYNAFTIRLILDYYPLESIQNIPNEKRWEDPRWEVGSHVWTLNEIEHEQIRPNFREPRIHFALVCAAVGCPPLRTEAYTGDRVDEQLASQTEYVHSHARWFKFDAERGVVRLTELYKWYGGDFEQYAPSVLDYAARFVPNLKQALESGRRPEIEWINYDWTLNDVSNKP